jgi:hypothetical protein
MNLIVVKAVEELHRDNDERRDQMGGKFIIEFDERGQHVGTDLGEGPIKPTHNLYDNPPPGEYVGSIDLGKMYFYRQPDGKVMRCVHVLCWIF